MVSSDPIMQIAQARAEQLRSLITQWEEESHKYTLMYEDPAIGEEYFQAAAREFLVSMIAEVQTSAPPTEKSARFEDAVIHAYN